MTDNADIDKVLVFPCRKSIRQFVCSVYVYLEIVSISRIRSGKVVGQADISASAILA